MNTPLRVLIVEDAIDDTLLLLEALREGGYDPIWQRVETATAMTVALAQQPWDLVIADHVLPHFGELCQAIEHNQLLLHYQPQLSLTSNRPVRAEALVRWQHPQRGLISPDQFVPLAEQTGLITPLSLWVLNAALREYHTWHRTPQDLQIAVNFSVQNLQETQLGDTVTTLLATWGVSPTQLTIELTEGALVTNPARARATLARLHDLGVQIAIDDFGTGYASLAHLRQLPVDEIKIDKSFVLGMKENHKDMAIVRSTIDLGHALGLQVVAEGVEDRATYDLLTTLGCDLVQGYYISRPLPDAEFMTWLQESLWYTDQASVIPY